MHVPELSFGEHEEICESLRNNSNGSTQVGTYNSHHIFVSSNFDLGTFMSFLFISHGLRGHIYTDIWKFRYLPDKNSAQFHLLEPKDYDRVKLNWYSSYIQITDLMSCKFVSLEVFTILEFIYFLERI